MQRLLYMCVLSAALASCAMGPNVTIRGDLSRPAREGGTRPAAGNERVAVRDFTMAIPPSAEVGRDFDQARSIVWDGSPGKSMADLVASALEERGIGVRRIAAGSETPSDLVVTIDGRVEEFRVEARRPRTLAVDMTGRVSVSLSLAGSGAEPGWRGSVASEYTVSDLYVDSIGVRNALNGAANGVAEEAAKRLIAEGLKGFGESGK